MFDIIVPKRRIRRRIGYGNKTCDIHSWRYFHPRIRTRGINDLNKGLYRLDKGRIRYLSITKRIRSMIRNE